MRSRGAPLRFLAIVTICWIGTRIALLWPQTGALPAAIRALAPAQIEIVASAVGIEPRLRTPSLEVARTTRAGVRRFPRGLSTRTETIKPVEQVPFPPSITLLADAARVSPTAPVLAPFPASSSNRIKPGVDRWSVSGWFVARAGRGIGAAPGASQIGGGQAGVRIAYMLAPPRRIAAFARITAPLAGEGREAAIGLEWQPGKTPLRILVERRFGLDRTPGGTGLGVAAGVDASLRGFRLEGYGQAGAIARNRVDLYADGAARLTRPLATHGVRLSLGAGAWGAAQRDARRLDIGPSATLSLGKVRIALDWRQRVLGRARPGSGLALTLGGDF